MGHNEVVLDATGEALFLNHSRASLPDIVGALNDQGHGKIADVLGQWASRVQSTPARRKNRFGGILDRDKFLAPTTYADKVRVAREALKDDVVGGAADGTEALAIDRVGIECDDVYQEDVWNQIAGDINLDGLLRGQWRALFTDSASVCAIWWGTKTYTPQRIANKAPARKKFTLQVPIGVTFLDVTKIVPVGSLMFHQEFLCYKADPLEAAIFDQILARRDGVPVPTRRAPALMPGRRPTAQLPSGPGQNVIVPPPMTTLTVDESVLNDPVVERLIVRKYIPDMLEASALMEDGVDDVTRLYLLDPSSVFRTTATRLDYQRFPDVRGESWFELLDLKAQLRQMDRVHLVGGAHMIILITKGSDQHEALPEEINALRASATTIASVPLIVGDHRLKVEIITPKLDMTLTRDKWDTLDVRLFARAWGTFIPTGDDLADPTKIGQVIGRNLNARRKMMRRDWEAKVLQAIRDRNPDLMTERAKMVFQPGNIALAFDKAWASFLLDLRQFGDIAQGTVLSQFGMSVADEARKVKRERDAYGPLFRENAPFNPFGPQAGDGGDGGDGADGGGDDGGDGGGDAPTTPTRVARRSGGRQGGGTRNGGGAAPGSGQGQEPVGRSRSGGGRRARATTDDGDDDA